MSTNSETYPRDNWWGEENHEVETAADKHRAGELEWRSRRQDKAVHVAHALLRGTAPALCAVTIADPARVPVELSEPKHYPVGEGHRTHMRQVRSNDDEGYLTGGESTAVVLDGTPYEEFMSVLQTWLDHCEHEGIVGAELAEELLRDGKRMKSASDRTDEHILSLLVRDVLAGARSV